MKSPVNNSDPLPLFVRNAKLCLMPAPRTIKTRFVLQRDEFSKALNSRFANFRGMLNGLDGCDRTLFALMVTSVAYRPNGKLNLFP